MYKYITENENWNENWNENLNRRDVLDTIIIN